MWGIVIPKEHLGILSLTRTILQVEFGYYA